SSNWAAFQWAAGKGSDTTVGWSVGPAYPTVNAAFYNVAPYTAMSGGAAAAITMAASPSAVARFFSLWLDARDEVGRSRIGYEVRFTQTATDVYPVTLSKWLGGIETVLTSQASVSFVSGNSFAIVDQGATVSAWANTGAGYTQLLSAADSTFNEGSVGLA